MHITVKDSISCQADEIRELEKYIVSQSAECKEILKKILNTEHLGGIAYIGDYESMVLPSLKKAGLLSEELDEYFDSEVYILEKDIDIYFDGEFFELDIERYTNAVKSLSKGEIECLVKQVEKDSYQNPLSILMVLVGYIRVKHLLNRWFDLKANLISEPEFRINLIRALAIGHIIHPIQKDINIV